MSWNQMLLFEFVELAKIIAVVPTNIIRFYQE